MSPTSEDIIEFWHERAAILEFDAGFSRYSAEMTARRQTSAYFGFECFEVILAERTRLCRAGALRSKKEALAKSI